MDTPGGISLATTAGTFDMEAWQVKRRAWADLFGRSSPMPETQSVDATAALEAATHAADDFALAAPGGISLTTTAGTLSVEAFQAKQRVWAAQRAAAVASLAQARQVIAVADARREAMGLVDPPGQAVPRGAEASGVRAKGRRRR